MKIKVKLPEMERRATGLYEPAVGVHLGSPELREDKAFPKIVGYAAVFNVLSEPLWEGVREKIRPGAFARAIAEGQDVRALVDHKPSMILGRTKAGTLRLNEDQHGLHYEIDPPDTNIGRDMLVSLRRRDIDQSSFGFRVKEEEYSIKEEIITRELIDVDLYDVSPVTYPAYPQTSVDVRSLWPELHEDIAKVTATNWFRHISHVLSPPKLLHAYEQKLRMRRLDIIGKEIRSHGSDTSKDVHTVIFAKLSWTESRSRVWLADNNFRADKMIETESYIQFRQLESPEVKEGSVVAVTENMPRGVKMLLCEKVLPVSAGSAIA